jgi:hypothetical protein
MAANLPPKSSPIDSAIVDDGPHNVKRSASKLTNPLSHRVPFFL